MRGKVGSAGREVGSAGPTTGPTAHPTARPTPGAVLRRAVAGQARLVAAAAVLLMGWQACESLVPVVIGAVIDHAIGPGDGGAVLRWTGVLAGLFALLSLSFRYGSRLSRRASEQAGHDARAEVAGVVLDPRVKPDPSRRAGALLSTASADADRVGQFCATVPRICGALVSVLVAAIALLRISVPLGLVVLLGAPPLLAAVHLLGAPLERRAGAEQANAAEAAGIATDVIGGLRVLKGIGGERAAADRYRAASQRSLHATMRAARMEALYRSATLLLTMCFLAVVALIGGRFAAEGRISVGDLVAAVGLAQFLLGPLSQLAAAGTALARARASAGRVADVLGAPAADRPAAAGGGASGALAVRSPVVDFAAAAGETVGVVAEPAAAAALVERLAAARYDDTEDVSVDGTSISAMSPAAARAALLVARHDAHLFAGSLLDNVQADAADEARAQAAILAADVDQVAEALGADGLQAAVSEQGQSLSGGQRQRVALARALAADPAVLVLHDPTTAVDAATEARIAAGLSALRSSRTTVLVTTSPALLAICDRVLLVTASAPVEGTHHGLAGEPAYRELVLS